MIPWMKTIVLLVMLFCAMEMASYSRAANNVPGLLEQSKKVLGGSKTDSVRWIEEKTGQYLPLELEFVDEQGDRVQLADIIDRPTIFLPIYFYCPNICSKKRPMLLGQKRIT